MTDDIENSPDEPITSGRKADGTFAKGNRANPSGRPRGSRHKYLVAAESLLDGEAEKLSRKAVELALAGDTTCLRICLERILPVRRDRPLTIELPEVKSIDDVAPAMAAIIDSVGSGEITPSEGSSMASLLQNYTSALELGELSKRLEMIEQRLENEA